MKKIIGTTITLGMLLAGTALANSPTSTLMKAKMASSTEIRKEKIEEKKSEIEARIGKKLDKERTKIAQRYEEALKNLNKLADKTATLISKFQTQGKNVASSSVLLTDARSKIATADADLTTLENMLASSTTKNRKALMKSTKAQAELTKTDIKKAHEAIIAVIKSLKPGRDEDKNASSTEQH